MLLDKMIQGKNEKWQKEKRKKNKDKEKKKITKIYKYGLNESKFIKKRDTHILLCKNLEIGMFWNRLSHQTKKNYDLNQIAWKKFDVLTKKEENMEKYKLLDNFSNYCGCWSINLRKK